jgi:hypothetical protein
LEESEDEVDRESVPPTIFAESKAGPKSGNKGQSEEEENEVDREGIPPTVSAKSKTGPKPVRGKNSKKK